jgi:hypothetical protein
MNEAVLRLIRSFAEQIAESDTGASQLYSNSIHDFSSKLEAFEPFRTIAASWVPHPMGGGRTGRSLSGVGVHNALSRGISAEEILASATRTVETNCYKAREVRPIYGITITNKQMLKDGAYLCPNSELSNCLEFRETFGRQIFGLNIVGESAALVQVVHVKPAIFPQNDHLIGSEPPELLTAREERSAYAKGVRLALGLASGGAVEMPSTYMEFDHDCIFSGLNVISGLPSTANFIPDRSVDIGRTIQFLNQLEVMKDPQALKLSIDRLLRSRRSDSFENRIIELGMAAEITLMHDQHGSGNGKSEITEKLSSRGAWLLGKDLHERHQVSHHLRELYAARSKVVHTGVAKKQLNEQLQDFDKVVSDIVCTILNRGKFPDWKELVLGAEIDRSKADN